jgi:hypothetical protein
MSKAWSKATDEQRRKHKESCIKDGRRRRVDNLCSRIFEHARSLDIDITNYVTFLMMLIKNKKLPIEDAKIPQYIKLLQKKMKPEKVYQRLFES